jgi:hypothetical protein
MNASAEAAADAALFARMRELWRTVDPVPTGLVDRMVAAVAVEDLTREYEMLTLVETAGMVAVRGETDASTLQFTDGTTTVLLHVTMAEDGARRIDGWVDAEALAVKLAQGEREWSADAEDHGRFSFDAVSSGMSRVRLVVRDADGEMREFQTPQFEV